MREEADHRPKKKEISTSKRYTKQLRKRAKVTYLRINYGFSFSTFILLFHLFLPFSLVWQLLLYMRLVTKTSKIVRIIKMK